MALCQVPNPDFATPLLAKLRGQSWETVRLQETKNLHDILHAIRRDSSIVA